MQFSSIASSSSGNTSVVISDDRSTAILIDAGIAYKHVKEGLARLGIEKIDGIFITHEHTDHVKGLRVTQKNLGCPVYIHELTLKAMLESHAGELATEPCLLKSGEPTVVGKFSVTDISTNHDSEYSCGYHIIEEGNPNTFTYFTDTGSITPLMRMYAEKCSSLFIESDYDDNQLELYPEYPDYLKERIRSDFGHLSNKQMASFIKSLKNVNGLKNVFVGHLSPRTNSQDLVLQTIQQIVPEHGAKFVFAPFEKFYDI